jgi:hypothetical protein
MVSARGIAGSEANVPVIAREAIIVARWIVVGLELDRHAEMHSERVGDGERHATKGAIGTAGH